MSFLTSEIIRVFERIIYENFFLLKIRNQLKNPTRIFKIFIFKQITNFCQIVSFPIFLFKNKVNY